MESVSPTHREAKLVQAFGPFVSPAPKKGEALGQGGGKGPPAPGGATPFERRKASRPPLGKQSQGRRSAPSFPSQKKGKAVGPGRERTPRARREANLVRAFGPFVPGPEKGKASGPGEARGRDEE